MSTDNKKPSTQQLISEICRHSGFKTSDIEAIWQKAANILPMPDQPLGLFPIARNIELLLAGVEQTNILITEQIDALRAWLQTLTWIPEDHPWRQLPELTARQSKTRQRDQVVLKAPLQSVLTSNPIWAMLWYRPFDAEQHHGIYLAIQKQLLLAAILIENNQIQMEEPKRLYEASLLVRRLSEPDQRALLDEVGKRSDTPVALFHHLLFIRDEKVDRQKSPHIAHGLGAFAQILGQAYGLPEPEGGIFQARNRSTSETRSRKQVRPDHLTLAEGHSYISCFISNKTSPTTKMWADDEIAITIDTITERDAAELVTEGLCPDEFDEPNLILVDPDILLPELDAEDDLGYLPPKKMLFARGRAVSDAIAMKNRRLRTDRQRIRTYHLSVVLNCLREVWHGLQEQNPVLRSSSLPKPGSAEAERLRDCVLIAMASFATGSSPETIMHIRSIEQIEDLPHGFDLVAFPSHCTWIRACTPPERHPLPSSDQSATIDTEAWLAIPDCFGITELLPLSQRRTLSGMRNQWDRYIKSQLSETGIPAKWQSFEAVSRMLPSWFSALDEADHLKAAMLFGLEDPLASTVRYYTAVERRHLAQYYQNELFGLLNRLGWPTQEGAHVHH